MMYSASPVKTFLTIDFKKQTYTIWSSVETADLLQGLVNKHLKHTCFSIALSGYNPGK